MGGVELSGGGGRILQGLRGKCPEAGEQTVEGSWGRTVRGARGRTIRGPGANCPAAVGRTAGGRSANIE